MFHRSKKFTPYSTCNEKIALKIESVNLNHYGHHTFARNKDRMYHNERYLVDCYDTLMMMKIFVILQNKLTQQ